MELTGNLFYFILITILGCICFSFLFLFLLSTRLFRKIVGDKFELYFLIILIVFGSLIITINLQAFLIIFIDRVLSGRLFWLNVYFGTVFLTMSITEVIIKRVESSERIRALLSIRPFTEIGLVLGNLLIVISYGVCCYLQVPSLL